MRNILTILATGLIFCVTAQYTSPFNELEVKSDSSDSYSFLLSGHFYGQGSNTTGYPVNTLLAHLDWINNRQDVMLVSLGDLFMDVKNDIPNYEKSFFSKLDIPLVNSVGNHDLTDDIYQQHYGQTNFSFEVGKDLHIVVDTEMNDGDMDDAQIDLIKKGTQSKYANVFIYSHRTVWKSTYHEMDGIFEDNTQAVMGNNFEKVVYPVLKEIGEDKHIYWFSGSLGDAPASFFYHEDENITYVATAIRGLKRDAILIVDVQEGSVSFTPHSLTGESLKAIDTYNVEFWQENAGKEPFNWRLLPLYIKQTVLNWAFWWGVFASSLILVIIRWIIKKRKSRLNHT